MSIAALNIAYRSPTRVRVVFSGALAAGAFSPSWFTFSSVDDLGSAPAVASAIIVANVSNAVELALAPPLVPGAGYELDITAGVPGADASTAPAATFPFAVPRPRQPPSAEIPLDDVDALVFGEDLSWNGTDFVESPDGDLEVISGVQNAVGALQRRAQADGLPHRRNFGGRLRALVDAPAPLLAVAAAQLNRELRRDDRLVNSTTTPTDQGDGKMLLVSKLELIGRQSRTINHNT